MSWRSIPILCYHNLDPTGGAQYGHPLRHFEQHLAVIQQLGFTTISAQHLLEICMGQAPHDKKYLVITFDDCHLSQWLYAIPRLAQRNMCGVFFAVSDFLWDGAPRTLADAPPQLSPEESLTAGLRGDPSQFMNRAEMMAAMQQGMEIYAHTARHQACFRNLKQIWTFSEQSHWSTWGIYPDVNPNYPVFEYGSAYAYNGFWPQFQDQKLSFRLRSDTERYEFCCADFRKSYQAIRDLNGLDRQLFCWPWGAFDDISLQALREAGFVGAFTLERSRNGRGKDPFRLSRLLVGRENSAAWLRTRLLMHGSALGANLFFKYFRKKPEVKRVMYLTDSTKLSGGSRQLLNNLAALREAGVQTALVAPSQSPVVQALHGTATETIPWDRFKKPFRSAWFLARLIRQRRFDVVHTFHSKAVKIGVLAKLLGGRWALFFNRGVIYAPNLLLGLFARIGNGVICNSATAQTILKRYFVPARRIHVVYNSFVGEVSVKPESKADSPVQVIYVGNAHRVKGYDIFLDTAYAYFQRYPDNHICFVAYGLERAVDLSRFGQQGTSDRIEVHGTVSHADVLQALQQADIFALTSRQESMPNVLLEAFAAALPVVCTDVGGVRELVHDGFNGYLCANEDVAGLVEKIHHLAVHPEERSRMGQLNAHLVSHELTSRHKGELLLRVYSGEHVQDTLTLTPIFSRRDAGTQGRKK